MTATVLEVHNGVWALFSAIEHVTTYDGEIVDAGGQPTTPALDDDGRVAAYAVLYLAPGRLRSLTLDGSQDSLDTTFQVTCVAGDPARLAWCIDQVRGALVGAAVTIGGRDHVIRASDINPAPRPVNEAVKPPRHEAPVLFTLFVP